MTIIMIIKSKYLCFHYFLIKINGRIIKSFHKINFFYYQAHTCLRFYTILSKFFDKYLLYSSFSSKNYNIFSYPYIIHVIARCFVLIKI